MNDPQLTTHPAQLRSFPTRTGAIRRSTNPLTRCAASDQKHVMGKNKSSANCPPSSGKGKQKATDNTPSPNPTQDQDWVICEPIRTQTPKRDRYWTDVVVWDLDDVRNLREILTMWVIMGVTASNIGEFLESVLYDRDEHLDGRLTQMTNNQEPHINIALVLLKHYQIRDEENKLLWEIKDSQLGDKTSCSGKHRPESSEPSEPSLSGKKARPKRPRISIPNIFRTPSRTQAAEREPPQTPTPKRNSWYQVPAPKPLRPFKKPYFLHDEPSRGIESANDMSGGTVCWSFNISEDLTMLTIAERRALMADTGALPPSFAAEIIDPASVMSLVSCSGTNCLQRQEMIQIQGQPMIQRVDSMVSYSSSDYGD